MATALIDRLTAKIIRKDAPYRGGNCKPLLQSCSRNHECCSDLCVLGLCT